MKSETDSKSIRKASSVLKALSNYYSEKQIVSIFRVEE
jgi:hypothetical protein